MTSVNVSGRQIPQVAAVATGEGLEVKNDSGNPLSTSVPQRSATTWSVESKATSTTILEANAARKGLLIYNASTQILYLSFAETASTANCFLALAAGAHVIFDQQLITGAEINGIWASANGSAQVTEFA